MAAAGTPSWQERVTFAYIDEPHFDQELKTYRGGPAHRDLMAAHGLGASEIDPVVRQRSDSP